MEKQWKKEKERERKRGEGEGKGKEKRKRRKRRKRKRTRREIRGILKIEDKKERKSKEANFSIKGAKKKTQIAKKAIKMNTRVKRRLAILIRRIRSTRKDINHIQHLKEEKRRKNNPPRERKNSVKLQSK